MSHNFIVMFENLLSENGLSLDRLSNFCLVAEKGGIARAYEGQASKQALVSRQIRDLEQFFGVELIRRRGRSIELTDSGRELARQIRLQLQGLLDFKIQCKNLPIEFRIAAGNSVLEWLLLPCMSEIARTVSSCAFALYDWRSKEIVQGLFDHTIDFGIVRRTAVAKPLKFRPLGKFGYSLFIPPALRPIANNSLADLPIAVAMGSEFLREFANAARTANTPPKIKFRCTSFTQAAQLALTGAAAAVLPDIAGPSIEQFAPSMSVGWLKRYRRDLGIAWSDRLVNTRPNARQVSEKLYECLKSKLISAQ